MTTQKIDLTALRNAFDALGPEYGIDVRRLAPRPDAYLYAFASRFWQFVQAVVNQAEAAAQPEQADADALLEAHAAAVIAAHEHGEQAGYYDDLRNAEQAIRAALAIPASTAATQHEHRDCGQCNGSGWMVRDSDIGTDQECFACDGKGQVEDDTPAAAATQHEHRARHLTDAELQNHEYVRGYVDECSETLGDVLAENKRLRAALAIPASTAAIARGYVSGTCATDHDSMGGKISLHYGSIEKAEQAFEALIPLLNGAPPESDVRVLAEELARHARQSGFIVSIEQRPRQPLAMGNHEDVVTVYQARGAK